MYIDCYMGFRECCFVDILVLYGIFLASVSKYFPTVDQIDNVSAESHRHVLGR